MNETTASERLFFACLPDATTARDLHRTGQQFTTADARPTTINNLHLTLVFLGQCDRIQRDGLIAAARQLEHPAFTVELDRIETWPGPRILAAVPDNPPVPLLALVKPLYSIAAGLGIKLDQRPYRPHVTLARRYRPATDQAIRQALRLHCTGFHLMRSTSTPAGVRYQSLHRFALINPSPNQ